MESWAIGSREATARNAERPDAAVGPWTPAKLLEFRVIWLRDDRGGHAGRARKNLLLRTRADSEGLSGVEGLGTIAIGFRATARGADSRDLAVRLVGVVAIRSRSRPDVVERFYERCRPRSTLEARPASGEAGARSTTRDRAVSPANVELRWATAP